MSSFTWVPETLVEFLSESSEHGTLMAKPDMRGEQAQAVMRPRVNKMSCSCTALLFLWPGELASLLTIKRT